MLKKVLNLLFISLLIQFLKQQVYIPWLWTLFSILVLNISVIRVFHMMHQMKSPQYYSILLLSSVHPEMDKYLILIKKMPKKSHFKVA